MANTISDKLTYLEGTKSAIKDAIVAKGVAVEDTATFRSYAEKIGEISGGGGGKIDFTLPYVNFNNTIIRQSDIDEIDFSKLERVANSKGNIKFQNSNFVGDIVLNLPQLKIANYMFYGTSLESKNNTFTLNEDVFVEVTSLEYAFSFGGTIKNYNLPSPLCTNYSNMFSQTGYSSTAVRIETFDVNTEAGNIFDKMFYYNPNLKSCKINLSNATNIGRAEYSSMFGQCQNLEDLEFYGTIPALNFLLNSCKVLTSQSVDNILNAIVENTTEFPRTITFHSDVYAALTEEQKALATSKNWTLASA